MDHDLLSPSFDSRTAVPSQRLRLPDDRQSFTGVGIAEMTSAIARLRELPEAFTFAGFCKLTRLSNQAASVWLTRWKEKGLIEAAGDRARIYFNKLKCNEVDGSLRTAALLFEYPSALLCGESVLHA